MHVRRQSNGLVEGQFTKNRNGSSDQSLTFRVGVEYVGIDADGDPISAPILEEISGDMSLPLMPLSAAEGAALRILKRMISGGPVRRHDWLLECASNNLVSNAIQQASRQRTVRRVADSLHEKGFIALNGEYVAEEKGGIDGR